MPTFKLYLQEKGSPATEVYLIIHGEVEAWAFNVSFV